MMKNCEGGNWSMQRVAGDKWRDPEKRRRENKGGGVEGRKGTLEDQFMFLLVSLSFVVIFFATLLDPEPLKILNCIFQPQSPYQIEISKLRVHLFVSHVAHLSFPEPHYLCGCSLSSLVPSLYLSYLNHLKSINTHLLALHNHFIYLNLQMLPDLLSIFKYIK